VHLHISDGEFEILVKVMVDLSLRNENGENLHYYSPHEWWEPHNYSEVLPTLLALLVSYFEMTVFDDLGEIDSSLTLWSIKSISKISFPNLFVNDFYIFFSYLWISFTIWKLPMSILRRFYIFYF